MDRIEVGEDNAINFVFNNIETVNLLEAIIENEKAIDKKDDRKLISIHRYIGNHLDINEPSVAIGGVC